MTDFFSRAAFRSVEEWKSALMNLPNSGFFELLRSVFGNIKTPFNKQRLLDDLFIFLSRAEIRKTIAAYISGKDHKIIAAIALLNEPAPGELESFFAGEYSFAELHALLLNLEERLIVFRFRDEKILRLALNPVLEKILAPFIADIRPLFPSLESCVSGDCRSSGESAVSPAARAKNEKKTRDAAPRTTGKISTGSFSDGRILAALFAFFLGGEEPLKTEGGTGLRKKILDDGKKIFPEIDLELALRNLFCLGLLRSGGRGLFPCGKKIAEYSGLSPAERQEYWAAGLYICLNEAEQDGNSEGTAAGGEIGPDAGSGAAVYNSVAHNNIACNGMAYNSAVEEISGSGVFSRTAAGGMPFRFFRNRLKGIASFIHRFRSLLEPGKQYSEIILRRLGELLGRGDGEKGNVWGAQLFTGKVRLPFEPFLEVMEKTGLLEKADAGWKNGGGPDVYGDDSGRESVPAAAPVIAMDTPLSFVLYPEISIADALALGAFCSVKKISGAAVSFELTRGSAVRGFDQGIEAAAMTTLLDRLSGNRLDANLCWTLKEWEKRYAEVSLHQGIILSLAEDRRYLAEAEPVASLIRRTLVPGLYLLSSDNRSEAVRALQKAGVDIVAQPSFGPEGNAGVDGPQREFLKTETGRAETDHTGFSRNSFPRLESLPAFSLPGPAGEEAEKAAGSAAEGEPDSAGSIQERFRRILEKMKITRQERDELAARIERCLVLTEAQLKEASLRYEKLEARGLDYAGKAAIVKQAISTGSLLEVSWPGSGGRLNRITGLPHALEKKEGDSVLVFKSVSRDEEDAADSDGIISGPGNTMRVPLGKISFLRRIKQSIFGG